MTGSAEQMAALQARIYEALKRIDGPLQQALAERTMVKTDDLGDGSFRHEITLQDDQLPPEPPQSRTAFHTREERRAREAVEALEELLDPLNPTPTVEDLEQLQRELLRIVRETSGPPSKPRPHPAIVSRRPVIGARRKVSIDKPPKPPSAKFKAHRKTKRRMERKARRGK